MKNEIQNSTLCYLIRDGKYLMLHRNKEKEDINEGKWIGVGGHNEPGESPEECIKREVKEETGLELKEMDFRGFITFTYGEGVTEYISLFTSCDFSGEETECSEGELKWIDIDKVMDLELWEGDRIFLKLLQERKTFFSLKLEYDLEDNLKRAVLNGKELALPHLDNSKFESRN